MPIEKAIEIVKGEAGRSFDPAVVDVLVRRYAELEASAAVHGRIEHLPTAVRVERGDAPATGFEKIAGSEASASVTRRDLDVIDHQLRGAPEGQRALTDLIRFTQECPTPEALLAALPDALRNMVPYDVMVLYRRTAHVLTPLCVAGDETGRMAQVGIPEGEGVSGWVAEHGKPIINGNPEVEPTWSGAAMGRGQLKSALAVPLVRDGGITGVLSLYRKDADAFTASNLTSLMALGSVVVAALENSAVAV
jgi:GAF domain-containing protein